MSSFSMILLAPLLLQMASSARLAHMELAAATATENAARTSANSSVESGHECCVAHQYDAGSCPCSVFEEDEKLRSAVCQRVRDPRSVEPARHCEKLQYKSNLQIMQCNLRQEKCISCSGSKLKDACREKKPCSYLKSNDKDSKMVCEMLRDRTLHEGIIMTPRYASKVLYNEDPRIECTEDELIDMCGVQPPCPMISMRVGKLEFVCNSLKKKMSTLKDISTSLNSKGVTCSPEDVSAICMVKAPPPPPPPSPCPEFDSQYRLARNVCLQIKDGQAFTQEKPATYAVASELLKTEKGIKCSAEYIEQLCLNVILPKFELEKKRKFK